MLIGREPELKILNAAYHSDISSFIAVYGRRRIGKTFLIREAFSNDFVFQHSGIYCGKRNEQLFAFSSSLKDAGLTGFKNPENWLEAFELLKDLIRSSNNEKKVIFIDELSWMDTPKSDLLMALEHFWNGWASARKDIVLIVCSSVTSWMLNKVIHNKGGLYNRLTERISLEPFTLRECELYAKARGLMMTRYQLIEAYMILGGVPYYWEFMKNELSLAQNIDYLFFAKNAPLKDEFDHLFSSLFKRPDAYIRIIKALASKKAGLTRNELIQLTGLDGSGAFSNRLIELEACGFIRAYSTFGKEFKERLYQLIDPFTLFYYSFLSARPSDEHYWTNQIGSPKLSSWSGLAFEIVCMWHIDEIKKALGISGVLTDVCSWSCKKDPENGINGSQIDLIIVRKDMVINLLEMKFSNDIYIINKKTDDDLKRKRNDFITAAKSRSAIHITMVTPYGIAQNAYSGNIQSQITAEDLFK